MEALLALAADGTGLQGREVLGAKEPNSLQQLSAAALQHVSRRLLYWA